MTDASGRMATPAGAALAMALAAMALAATTLAGCTPLPPPSHAEQAAASACETAADRTFNTQNRYLLSERDQRDTPFSVSGLPGVTSNGLGQRYGRDEQLAGCLRENSETTDTALSQSATGTRVAPGSIAPSPVQ